MTATLNPTVKTPTQRTITRILIRPTPRTTNPGTDNLDGLGANPTNESESGSAEPDANSGTNSGETSTSDLDENAEFGQP